MIDSYKDLAGYRIRHAILLQNSIGFDQSRENPVKVGVIYFSVVKDNKTLSVYCVNTGNKDWSPELIAGYVGKGITSAPVIRKAQNSYLLPKLEDLILE